MAQMIAKFFGRYARKHWSSGEYSFLLVQLQSEFIQVAHLLLPWFCHGLGLHPFSANNELGCK